MPIDADAVNSVTPGPSGSCRLSRAPAVVARCDGSGSRSGGPGSAGATAWPRRPGRAWSRRPATWPASTPPTRRRCSWPPGPGCATPRSRPWRRPCTRTGTWSGSWACAGPCSSSRSSSWVWSRPPAPTRSPSSSGACWSTWSAGPGWPRTRPAGSRRWGRSRSRPWRPAAGRPPPRSPRTTPAWACRWWSPRASRTRAARAWSPACCCCWPPRAASSGAVPAAPGSAASTAGRWSTPGCRAACPNGRSRTPRPSWSAAGSPGSGRPRSPT